MSISLSEIVVVFVVALLLFGPEQLPQIARQIGKITGELRKATTAVRREWYNAVYPPAQEMRREFEGEARQLRALRAEIMAPPIVEESAKPTATSSEPLKPPVGRSEEPSQS